MNEFKNILVKGGYTGKKLHRASNGSSSLSCGHWTKTHITKFQVADNVDPETLAKFHDDGYEMCEKCFPQFAVADKPKKYTGPKYHINRLSPRMVDGVIKLKKWQGSGCGRRNDWSVTYKEFKKMYEDTPEKCCKGCVKNFVELQKQCRELNK